MADLYCNSFSFRSDGHRFENCYLSSVEARDIDPVEDLLRDEEWDVYENIRGGRICEFDNDDDGDFGSDDGGRFGLELSGYLFYWYSDIYSVPQIMRSRVFRYLTITP